ncbi:MAG: hypothetical protein PHS59_17615 [Paludibacter sp.]|nr:hypothetical protein [Paludibacter sp.]
MEDTNKKKLEEMLLKHDDSQRKIKEQAEQQQIKRKTFLDNFEEFANSTIKPIMLEIGDVIKKNGHDYKVTFEKEYKNDKGVTIDSRITMDIFPNGNGRGDIYNVPAHILFYAEKFSEKIGLHENNIVPGGGGGSAGKKDGEYNLETLTSEIIEKEIVDSIGNILKV